jgi:hypothetical protein
VICSVSILVETASSVLAPLKAGWNCAKSFMHEQLLPKHNLGLGYELEGWKLVELLFIWRVWFQNAINTKSKISELTIPWSCTNKLEVCQIVI